MLLPNTRSICTVTFCLGGDLFTLCIQIFADAPESCSLSPAAPVFSAPTRQSKKLSRQNRPLAVYNPQAIDIQNGKTCTPVHFHITAYVKGTAFSLLDDELLKSWSEPQRVDWSSSFDLKRMQACLLIHLQSSTGKHQTLYRFQQIPHFYFLD